MDEDIQEHDEPIFEASPSAEPYRVRQDDIAQGTVALKIFEAFRDNPQALEKYRNRPSHGRESIEVDLEESGLFEEILRRIKESDNIVILGVPMDSESDTTDDLIKVHVTLTGDLLCFANVDVWLPKKKLTQSFSPRKNTEKSTAIVTKKLKDLLGKLGIRW